MACATMKRSLDFDPLHSPGGSPKRRRCLPGVSPSPSPHIGCRQTSPFSSVSPKISPSQLAQNICQEWKRIKRRKRLGDSFPDDQPSQSSLTSHGLYPSYPPDSSTSLAAFTTSSPSFPTSSFSFTPSTSQQSQEVDGDASLSHDPSGNASRGREQPLFTLSQVIMICERMLKEQESRIKEEYDKVLSCKLAEQYDSFVRFNQDQMRRRFGDNAASYVSWGKEDIFGRNQSSLAKVGSRRAVSTKHFGCKELFIFLLRCHTCVSKFRT